MEHQQDMPAAPAFPGLSDQINALQGMAQATVTGGHHDLGPDLWLSSDPAGQTVMSCGPGEHGVRLTLEAGDSGAWACLGMRLPPEVLRRGRYLGLLLDVRAEGVISFTPTLRYFLADGGMHDEAAPMPVLLAGGARTHLSHIPLDPDRAQQARGCELNLFFSSDAFAAEFAKIEPLLIL